MRSKIIIFYILCLFAPLLQAQDKKIDIEFHGFVKADYFLDSRQTVNARAGHFLLFPKGANPDINGADINASPSLNMLAIQTRLKTLITGPEFFGAKSSALIEGAFFGHSNEDINGFRLRHAFITLNWDNLEILMGQYWHPMFITKSFPEVYSFNTGAPFQPFSRNPQLRLSYSIRKLTLLGTLYGQRDFTSRGPSGVSCEYLRNSAVPAMNLQFQYGQGFLFAGAGLDFKLIRPVLSIDGVKYEKNLPALSYQGFVKIRKGNSQIKVEGVYGENLADLLMLGGIAETMKEGETGFTNFRTISFWTDMSTSFKNMEYGMFAGFSRNLGTENPLGGQIYALGGDIAGLWRISVRSSLVSGPTRIGLEMEGTRAQYGILQLDAKQLDTEGIEPVTNFRLLLFAMYSF